MQNPSNLAEEAKKVPLNHPYIGVVASDDSFSFIVVTDWLLVLTTNSFFKALRDTMACFYVFNIDFLKVCTNPLYLFNIFVFSIKEENILQALIRFISSMNRL